MELTCGLTYQPSSAADNVPWRYVIADASGVTLSTGWAPSRTDAMLRARKDADAIRGGALVTVPPETFAV